MISTEKLAERLVNPTLFEVEGWKRISFFPKTFDIFGFEKDSITLTYEKVEHPTATSYAKTFLVSNKSY